MAADDRAGGGGGVGVVWVGAEFVAGGEGVRRSLCATVVTYRSYSSRLNL
jgi:hypothetical protein